MEFLKNSLDITSVEEATMIDKNQNMKKLKKTPKSIEKDDERDGNVGKDSSNIRISNERPRMYKFHYMDEYENEDLRKDAKYKKDISFIVDDSLFREKEYKKRSRTIMSSEQSKILSDFFEKNPFPSTELREQISKTLNMKPRTVQIWFQNQRQKYKSKKEHLDKFYFKNKIYKSLNVLANVAVSILNEREKKPRNYV